jgi:hypothetical protein
MMQPESESYRTSQAVEIAEQKLEVVEVTEDVREKSSSVKTSENKDEVIIEKSSFIKSSEDKKEIQRAILTKPAGVKNFASVNPGIMDSQEKKSANTTTSTVQTFEAFTQDELSKAWKDFALEMKTRGRDRFHATLNMAVLTLRPDYNIFIEVNAAQQAEIEAEKEQLLIWLRQKLRNGKISLTTNVTEVKKVNIADSKSVFEQMAEKNPALIKMRDLLGLDLEY